MRTVTQSQNQQQYGRWAGWQLDLHQTAWRSPIEQRGSRSSMLWWVLIIVFAQMAWEYLYSSLSSKSIICPATFSSIDVNHLNTKSCTHHPAVAAPKKQPPKFCLEIIASAQIELLTIERGDDCPFDIRVVSKMCNIMVHCYHGRDNSTIHLLTWRWTKKERKSEPVISTRSG